MVDLITVITMPDRKSGRGQKRTQPPIAKFCEDYKLPCFQTKNINDENDFLNFLKTRKIDLIVVLAFSQFFSSDLIDLPRIGCFNIHTSLLPKWRGAAPIQYALLRGEERTGITILRMTLKMDAGDLVLQDELPIKSFETSTMLTLRLKFKAIETLDKFFVLLENDKITYTPQDLSKISYAPSIDKKDGMIDFKNETAARIVDRVRAFHLKPGSYCLLSSKKRLKILEAIPFVGMSLEPGVFDTSLGFLLVGTADKGLLRLSCIQLEGRKKTSDQDFINGLQKSPLKLQEKLR